jgi:phage terminase Nu1 subunit (DNA packaging protein)
MSEYTPTTDEVRAMYVTGTPPHRVSVPQGNAEFDRWLAQHDAEVAARALRQAADDWQTGEWANVPRHADRVADRLGAAQYVSDWLRARAEKKAGR